MEMIMKVKIGQAYQPQRLTRRGNNGSYSAYRPLTGHDIERWNAPIDRYLPIVCAVAIVAIFAMLALGVIA